MNQRLRLLLLILLTCAIGLGLRGAQSASPPFDLLFRDARIVDGTGNPWRRGEVAIRGDRIVAVGKVTGAAAKVVRTKFPLPR